MNCFHFCIFELSKAFCLNRPNRPNLLWIAFIFVSLNYQKHFSRVDTLLSPVVNCFHFCIFELSKALTTSLIATEPLLWIAFIFVSLNYQKHFSATNRAFATCCELLSFLYLWTIKSICRSSLMSFKEVVNCFHFCIFELSKAFIVTAEHVRNGLWIAFIFVSLNYQKHYDVCISLIYRKI